MSIYDTGILMTSGFSIASGKPADLKYLADTIQDRDNYVTDKLAYEGMLVYVISEEKTYQYKKTGWEEFGFNLDKFISNIYDGLDSDNATLSLSANQGKVLNKKITDHIDSNIIHITEEERIKWNNKIDSTTLVTQTSDGLMSKSDKIKLDSINKHPETHPATIIEEDETHRFVSDAQIESWDNKASNTTATQSKDGLMSYLDKLKLDSIDEINGNYTHPSTHPATMIVEDETHRFVTDTQISSWDNKASNATATQSKDGLMSHLDKLKLDSIDAISGNYTHPETHPATIITEDTTHRFVTDAQISSWDELIEKVAALEAKMKTAVFYK